MPIDVLEGKALNSIGGFRDILAAAVFGVVTEALLAWRAYVVQNQLVGRHFWIEVSQMPAFHIVQRPGSHMSYFQALAFIFCFQATLYALLGLSLIYLYRLLHRGSREESSGEGNASGS